MMPPRKMTKKYYFSVEGETEKWYFDWLCDKINQCEDAKFRVSFNTAVQKNPLKRAKSLNVSEKTMITHVFDYESNDEEHRTAFIETLDRMKEVDKLLRQIRYQLGYSNFTFELWMVLHKVDCNGQLAHRRQYLDSINAAFGEHFATLDEYKREDNFKRVLRAIELSDVVQAVMRGKQIMARNAEAGYTLLNYRKFRYYQENPSLSIGESIHKVLADCGIMDSDLSV